MKSKFKVWQLIVATLFFTIVVYFMLSDNTKDNSLKLISSDTDTSTDRAYTARQKSSTELAKEIGEHSIPAEALKPAPVENIVFPKPVEPPNPATHPPSELNPGGVNGRRPPRK